jgi:hypothetical protein
MTKRDLLARTTGYELSEWAALYRVEAEERAAAEAAATAE